jgi:hypothetical protein
MARPYSMDLRARAIARVQAGETHARRGELRNDDKLVCGNMGEQGFEKALKR